LEALERNLKKGKHWEAHGSTWKHWEALGSTWKYLESLESTGKHREAPGTLLKKLLLKIW
jgi:hypothetical protein